MADQQIATVRMRNPDDPCNAYIESDDEWCERPSDHPDDCQGARQR